MGIEDRDYYRQGRSGRYFRSDGAVCRTIIVASVVVYLLQILSGPHEPLTRWLRLDPDHAWQLWRFVTYGFCHDPGNLFHILFNMLFVWWFGPEIERMYGPREFARFYATGLILSGIAHLVFVAFLGQGQSAIGASGAVIALTVLYAWYYPRRRILIFFVFPIEIRWLVLIYLIFDLHPVLAALAGWEGGGSGVAHAAHLGGLCYGYLYGRFDLRYTRWWPGWRIPSLGRLFRRRRLRVYHESPESSEAPELPRRPQATDSGLDARVDEVLAKLHREGQDSLTDEEREVLIRASKRYRNR